LKPAIAPILQLAVNRSISVESGQFRK